MNAPVPVCRACREPIEDPDDAVYLGHEEGNSGPGWDIHAHRAHIDQAGLDPVAARLNPGGRFVFSQPPAIPGAYGPQGMYKGGFAGKAMFTYRYSYRPAVWERLLTRAGFTSAKAVVLDAPTEGHIGTLLVNAGT